MKPPFAQPFTFTALVQTALLAGMWCAQEVVAADVSASVPHDRAVEFNATKDDWPAAEHIAHTVNAAYAAKGPLAAPQVVWPPAGVPIRIAITEDDRFSAYPGEQESNGGKVDQWKLKGQIEYSIFNVDAKPLAGKVVTGALLHLKTASPDWPYRRVGISSVATRWAEGSVSKLYESVPGEPCFLQAELGQRDWAYPGSTVMDAVLGRGHTVWKFADSSAPDADGWQRVAVDPEVVRARIAGVSHGFFCYDEVGHEWEDTGGKFSYWSNPNRFSYSRDSSFAPWLEVWVDGEDHLPPNAIRYTKVETAEFPAGQAMVRWITPADQGSAGVVGYVVSYTDSAGVSKDLPRYLVPMAGALGSECRMHIQDLPFTSGQRLTLSISAVDGAGNVGPACEREIMLSDIPASYPIQDSGHSAFAPSEKLPEVNGIKVSVIDLLDKVEPVTGVMIPEQAPGYKGGNHLFSSTENTVRLHSGRNEFQFFQVLLEAEKAEATIAVNFPDAQSIKAEWYEFGYVREGDLILPDPLLPSNGSISIPSHAGKLTVPGQRSHSMICDLFIPHATTPGMHRGTLTIGSGDQSLSIAIELTVWDFTLPNKLSFIPEMNSYMHAAPDVYRMSHKFRTCLNELPYGWATTPRSTWRYADGTWDWAAFTAKYGPLFDGSLFTDLPRSGEPVDIAYLGFNENWPVSLPENFTGSYWADEAFTQTYIDGMQQAYISFAKHCDEQGWTDTLLHLFLNNKIYYREEQRKVVAPWILDEPRETSDYWALRWYGLLLNDAVQKAGGKAKIMNRTDISYSQFGRDMLWGAQGWECLGGTNDQKLRMKYDEYRLWGRSYLSSYGAANHVADANTQATNWILKAWSYGADSILAWQTRAKEDSWVNAWEQAIFYPHEEGVVASVRLRAFTRGQQIIEYLTLLGHWAEVPRWRLENGLRDAYDFSGKIVKTSESDAGTIHFASRFPSSIWKLQMDLGTMVNRLKPPYERALKAWDVPDTAFENLPNIGYTPVSPTVERHRPVIDTFGKP